jgi:hypothetical protein
LSLVAAAAALMGGACAPGDDAQAGRASGLEGPAIVVNECMSGSSGWVELVNTTTAAVDLAGDATSCWFVDDGEGGGAPRAISDANVNHAAGSPTCAAAGRGAACGLIAPGEHAWVKLSFINSVTPDACRLLAAPRSGGACGTAVDLGVGGPTASSAAGQCFGRQPDLGPWSATAIECTQGAANPCGPGGCGPPPTDAGGADAGADAAPDVAADAPPDALADAGAPGGPPAIVRIGRPDRLLLSGTVVTPDVAFEGDVLIAGDVIACVAPSCADDPSAADATAVATNGIIFPGLIDAHNHILFDIFDETDWSPAKLYTNHNQWPNEPRYKAMVDAKQ